jgi:hypothetical protein
MYEFNFKCNNLQDKSHYSGKIDVAFIKFPLYFMVINSQKSPLIFSSEDII